MKKMLRHTALIVLGTVINGMLLFIGMVVLSATNNETVVIIPIILPLLLMTIVMLLSMMNLEEHFESNEQDVQQAKEDFIKHSLGIIVISTVLGVAFNYLYIKHLMTYNLLNEAIEVFIIYALYAFPYSVLIYSRLMNLTSLFKGNLILGLYYIGVIASSMIGIGLVTSFYETGIILGILVIGVSYFFVYKMSGLTDDKDTVHKGKQLTDDNNHEYNDDKRIRTGV